MLTTLLPPTSGTATVAGHDIVADPARGPPQHRLHRAGQRRRPQLAGTRRTGHAGPVLRDAKPDVGGPGRRADGRAGAGRPGERTVSTLSGGQRRRLDVAMGLMHRPPLLFLDEPSTGMDPQNRANLWEHVLGLHRQGTTIVLTTHYLEEADAFAERVVVIDHGEIIADDTAAELKAELAGDRLAVTVSRSPTSAATAERIARVRQRAGPSSAPATRCGSRSAPGRATGCCPVCSRNCPRRGSRSGPPNRRQPTLDDVFLNLTGRSLREQVAADSDVQHVRRQCRANAKVSA